MSLPQESVTSRLAFCKYLPVTSAIPCVPSAVTPGEYVAITVRSVVPILIEAVAMPVLYVKAAALAFVPFNKAVVALKNQQKL